MCPLTQLKLEEWRGEMVREQRMPTNILSRNENHGLPLKNTVRRCLVVGWRSSGLHICRDTNSYLWQLLLLSDNADRQGWRYGQFHRNLRRHAHRHRAESQDRKSTRLNSSHGYISYAVFCLKKKKNNATARRRSRGSNACRLPTTRAGTLQRCRDAPRALSAMLRAGRRRARRLTRRSRPRGL